MAQFNFVGGRPDSTSKFQIEGIFDSALTLNNALWNMPYGPLNEYIKLQVNKCLETTVLVVPSLDVRNRQKHALWMARSVIDEIKLEHELANPIVHSVPTLDTLAEKTNYVCTYRRNASYKMLLAYKLCAQLLRDDKAFIHGNTNKNLVDAMKLSALKISWSVDLMHFTDFCSDFEHPWLKIVTLVLLLCNRHVISIDMNAAVEDTIVTVSQAIDAMVNFSKQVRIRCVFYCVPDIIKIQSALSLVALSEKVTKYTNQCDEKEERANYISRQRDEKNKGIVKLYEAKMAQLTQKERGSLTGNFNTDMEFFHVMLVEEGYASSQLLLIPSSLIKQLFTHYLQGYGLQNYHKITRQYLEGKILNEVPTTISTPQGGCCGRQILLKTFLWKYSKKFPHIASVMEGYKNQMFGGFFSDVGTKIAEGFKKEVIPVWESIVANLTSFKNSSLELIKGCSVFLGGFAFAVLIGVVGYVVVNKYSEVIFGTQPTTSEDPENQMLEVATGLISRTFTSWCDHLGAASDSFISKFSDLHMEKSLEKFGKLSSAFNNIYTMLARLKDVFKYIIDKSWSFIFGVPYFESTKVLQKVVATVNELLAVVRTGDIENKGNDDKKKFCTAFEDLVEMAPYIGRFDNALHTQINAAIATTQSTYNSVKETIRFSAARQKPIWLYLRGDPGKGKTVFTVQFCRLLFEYLKEYHSKEWKDIGRMNFDQTLIYTRQAEQEYWDRYSNQWITVYDDLLQVRDPKSEEAFSLIRAKTDAPYPLHMASISRKETTTFQSKVIVSSTNFPEKDLDGLPGIVDVRAFKRRRDLVVDVCREGPACDDYWELSAIENLTFKVWEVDDQTGKLTLSNECKGLEGAKYIVRRMAKKYLHYCKTAKDSEAFEPLAKGFWQILPEPNIDGSSSSSSSSSQNTSNSSTTTTMAENQCGRTDENRVDLLAPIKYFGVSLHESVKALLLKVNGVACTTVAQARAQIEIIRKKMPNSIFSDKRFDSQFLYRGVRILEKKATLTFGLTPRNWEHFLELYDEIRVKDDSMTIEFKGQLCLLLKKDYDIDVQPYHIRSYIGLTNPIYWHPKKAEIMQRLKDIGCPPITYDEVSMYCKNKEFLTDKTHEATLRKYEGGSKLLAETSRTKKALLALVLCAGTAAAIVTAVLTMFPQYESQSNAKYLEKLKKELAKRPTRFLGRMAPQNQFTDEQTRAVLPKINKNLWGIEIETVEGRKFNQFATGIEANIFVTAGHLFEFDNIRLLRMWPTETDANMYEMNFGDVRWKVVDSDGKRSLRDLVLFSIPSTNSVKTVTHFLPKRGEKYDNREGCARLDRWEALSKEDQKKNDQLYTLDKDGNPQKASPQSSYVLVGATTPVQSISLTDVGECKVNLINTYRVYITHCTIRGDCGKPYVWFNPQIPSKILGFHTAGNLMEALLSPLFQEDVEEFKQWLNTTRTDFQNQFHIMTMDDVHLHEDDTLVYEENCDTTYLGMPQVGQLSQKFVWPRKTKLIPTQLVSRTTVMIDKQAVVMDPPFEVTHAPAVLFKKGDLDPVPISLRQLKTKINRYTTVFRDREMYDGIFGEATKFMTGKFLSKSEALKGVVGWLHSNPCPRNTSMAFPYQKEGNKGHFYLSTQEHYDELPLSEKGRFRKIGECWLDYRIDDLVDKWFDAVRKGKIPPSLVLYCLKDEPRPLDRVAAAKTRAFFMGGFVLMIVTTMIFGELFNCLETKHSDTDSAVGVNPYSCEWRIMYEQLATYGDDVIDDDTAGYDLNFPATSFKDGFPEIYCKEVGFKPGSFEAACVFACVFANLLMLIVIEDKVYELQGMPSGCKVTSLFNTICNSVMNRSIVKALVPHKHFRDIAKMKCFGDDLLMVIRKIFQDLVNRENMRKLAKEMFNHDRTDPRKSTEAKGFSKLSEAWFLQRQFKVQDGVVLSPLNIESIHTMLHWIMKPSDKTIAAQFVINVDQAMMELTRHGKEMFEKYKTILNYYLANYGNTYLYRRTYEEMRIDMIMRATSPV